MDLITWFRLRRNSKKLRPRLKLRLPLLRQMVLRSSNQQRNHGANLNRDKHPPRDPPNLPRKPKENLHRGQAKLQKQQNLLNFLILLTVLITSLCLRTIHTLRNHLLLWKTFNSLTPPCLTRSNKTT